MRFLALGPSTFTTAPVCLPRDSSLMHNKLLVAQDELSGADIKALCTEAGLLALRERRMRVTHVDFKKVRLQILEVCGGSQQPEGRRGVS